MAKQYIVRLTKNERTDLEDLVFKGKVAAHKRLHAQILLKVDVSDLGGKWTDSQISEALGISTRTVERVRQWLVKEGLESALNRAKPSRVRSRVLDGENEAHLVALTCTEAPDGRNRWTLRLLGQRMVELNCVESVSHETIPQTLKNELKPWQSKEWCIPAQQNAEFVYVNQICAGASINPDIAVTLPARALIYRKATPLAHESAVISVAPVAMI